MKKKRRKKEVEMDWLLLDDSELAHISPTREPDPAPTAEQRAEMKRIAKEVFKDYL